MSELPLVVFTLLAQAAVGTFVILVVLETLTGEPAVEAGAQSSTGLAGVQPYAWPFLLVVLAMLVSLAHLVNPLHAPFTIFNLGSSWLSREIFSLILFAAGWFVFLGMAWRGIGGYTGRRLVSQVTAVLGILLVFVMARAYMIPMQPAWNTGLTMVIFYAAAALMGALLVCFLLKSRAGALSSATVREMQVVVNTAAVAGVVALVAIPARYLLLKNSAVPEAVASAGLIDGQYLALFVGGVVLLVAALVLFLVYRARFKRQLAASSFLYLAAGLFLLALIADRVIFYLAHVKIGLL